MNWMTMIPHYPESSTHRVYERELVRVRRRWLELAREIEGWKAVELRSRTPEQLLTLSVDYREKKAQVGMLALEDEIHALHKRIDDAKQEEIP